MTRGAARWARGLGLGLLCLLMVPTLLAGGPVPGHPAAPAGPGSLGIAGAPGLAVDPLTAGEGVGRIFVTCTDPAAVPNDGLRTEFQAFKVEPFSGLSSLQVGVEEVLGPSLVVFGLFQNSPTGAYPFFSVFDNSTGRTLYQANESYDIVAPGSTADFALQDSGGTNWTLEVNGALFGGSYATATKDFGVATSTQPGAIAFSMIALSQFPVVPPSTEVFTALAVHHASGWYLPTSANSTWRGARPVEWGIEGAAQDPALWPGEVVLGTNESIVPNGTPLWSGGPRPAMATLASAPSTTFGGGTSLVTAKFSNASGPLANVPAELSDAEGGSFANAYLSTDLNGSASTAYIAPNATGNLTDQLTVSSDILGMGASGTTTVAVTPAVPVTLRVVGSPSVPVGGTAAVELRASTASGTPIPSLLLAAILVGGGFVIPDTGVTDQAGDLTLNVTAPPAPMTLNLNVVVSTPGYWGRTRILIPNSIPAPPLSQLILAQVDWLVLLGIVVLAVGVYRWTRLPRCRLPPMDLRRRRTPPS
ncbi:MAG: hypothetical protein L3K08_04070, partial [Thermoplasmata archaeon]|nr:hypothetical protein [Thermoplasmata archaeon]